MEQQYGDDFITITDEDGTNYELEVLSTLDYNGSTYLALCAADDLDSDEETDLEVSFLKVVEEDGEEILCAIEDEEELAASIVCLSSSPTRTKKNNISLLGSTPDSFKPTSCYRDAGLLLSIAGLPAAFAVGSWKQ